MQNQTEYGSSDSQVWISSQGLPLRQEIDVMAAGVGGKSHRSVRFTYTGVKTPRGRDRPLRSTGRASCTLLRPDGSIVFVKSKVFGGLSQPVLVQRFRASQYPTLPGSRVGRATYPNCVGGPVIAEERPPRPISRVCARTVPDRRKEHRHTPRWPQDRYLLGLHPAVKLGMR